MYMYMTHTHTHMHTLTHTYMYIWTHVCTYLCIRTRYLNDSSHHSIIYRGSDLDLSTVTGATCGSTHDDIQQEMLMTQMIGYTRDKGRRLRKRQQNPPYPDYPNADPSRARCWLNVIGDFKFVQSVGGTGTAMAQLLNIIQQVLHIYTGFSPG